MYFLGLKKYCFLYYAVELPNCFFIYIYKQDTLDYVAYVAKDPNDYRACYILECGGGLAQDVISTIGQAFELRFKQHQSNPSRM